MSNTRLFKWMTATLLITLSIVNIDYISPYIHRTIKLSRSTYIIIMMHASLHTMYFSVILPISNGIIIAALKYRALAHISQTLNLGTNSLSWRTSCHQISGSPETTKCGFKIPDCSEIIFTVKVQFRGPIRQKGPLLQEESYLPTIVRFSALNVHTFHLIHIEFWWQIFFRKHGKSTPTIVETTMF